jgi:predicted transcriptional regulator
MRTHAERSFRVEDIMTQEVIAVSPSTSLAAVIQLFLHHAIAGAPVVDEEGRPIGMITSTDLLDSTRRSDTLGQPRYFRLWRGDVRAVGIADEGGEAVRGVVADVMTPDVLGIDRRLTVRDAAQLMARADVHRLVVTDNGRACGVVTTMDCLKALTKPPC